MVARRMLRLVLFVAAAWTGCQAEGDYMVIMGGGFHPRDIEVFHPDTGSQILLPTPKLAGNGRMYHVSSQVNETHVLIAGGRDPRTKQRLNTAALFNLKENTLVPIAQVNETHVLIAGGRDPRTKQRLNTAALFNLKENTLVPIAQVNETHVLIAGGRDPRTKQRLNTAALFNLKENTLVPIAQTGEERSGAAAATVDGNVFVCGGLEGRKDRRCATNKCERWNGHGWSYVADLRQDRAIFAMVAMEGKLYALGGEINAGPCDTADAYTVLNTVERYDPRVDRWDKVTPMINKRYAHAAAVYQGKIWACGGHFDANYETERTSGCETYDPSTDKWALAAQTSKPRAGNALLNLNGHLYTVGGAAIPLTNRWFDYDYTPFTLEELNAGNLTWSLHREFLKHRAYGASVSAVAARVAPYKDFHPQAAAVTAGGSRTRTFLFAGLLPLALLSLA